MMVMICWYKCILYILNRTNYYALFIAVPLTLNYNYLEASVCHFTVIIYGLHTRKSTFDKLHVAFNNTYRSVLNLHWQCSACAMYANFCPIFRSCN